VNEAYWDICALRPWRWARKRTQFASVAQVTSTVTAISTTTITLSDTIATTMAGRKFLVDSDGIPHRISAHTAGSSTLTLAVAYTGDATSGAATIYQDEITVASDILAFPTVKQLHWGNDLIVIPETELFSISAANTWGTDRSRYGAFISNSVLRIAPWTEDAELFEITYNYRPEPLDFTGSAADTPILPRDQRVAIALRALVKLFTDKRDDRLSLAAEEFQQQLDKMSSIETTFAKYRMRPRGGGLGVMR
jgi:hypothetical protein